MANAVIRPTLKLVRLGYVVILLVAVTPLVLERALKLDRSLWWLSAALLLLLLAPLRRHLQIAFTRMTIESDRLKYESGLMSRTSRALQLSRVQDVRVDRSLWQRLAGIGDLTLETAGESSRLTIRDIDHPQEVADRILEAARHLPGSAAPGTSQGL
jgi:uncharacterized membrane protein YdbT with pleckstrin-like domain